eukprot:403351389
MGRFYVQYITELHETPIICKNCDTHLSKISSIKDVNYSCSNGKAYYIIDVINAFIKDQYQVDFTTGKHDICDIQCSVCLEKLGWKYIKAYDESNKHKENRFALDQSKIR